MDLSPRLRAVCDLDVSEVREYAGRHEYDGKPQDLSPAGVRAGLAALAAARDGGERLADAHDEAHLAAAEEQKHVTYATLELHRRNPILHLSELDLAGYDRDYAPREERDAARAEHLAAWPRVADAAVGALDQVSAPVAQSLLGGIRGLAAALGEGPGISEAALAAARAAHARLVAHVELAAADGDPDPALGGPGLTALMSSAEAMPVDLGRLAGQADAERDRLHALLADGCARIEPDNSRPALDVARELVRDHPDGSGVIEAARVWTERAIRFTREHGLVPYNDGECLVGLAPESRRWAMAMMSWAAPGEPEGPSWYHITPPEESWPRQEQEEWLEVFSHTTLPGITVHEVAPGHFSHGRAMRHLTSPVRRTLHSSAFIEGWAHYGEELCVEEGFGRPPDRCRRLAGGAGAGDQAGVRHRRALGRDDDRRGGAPVRGRYPPVRSGGAVRGPAGHLRPDLRPVHLGQAGDPQAPRAGQEGMGRGLHPAALPQGDAGPRLSPDRPARHRRGPRLIARGARGSLWSCAH
jgi:hypothetical protein